MMKIAITGGSGFIGTHLVNLLKKEHDILILDRAPSKIHDVDFIECDLSEKSFLLVLQLEFQFLVCPSLKPVGFTLVPILFILFFMF